MSRTKFRIGDTVEINYPGTLYHKRLGKIASFRGSKTIQSPPDRYAQVYIYSTKDTIPLPESKLIKV